MDKELYKIRDLLFGTDDKNRNIKKALLRASQSNHPEAQWLWNVCKYNHIESRKELIALLLSFSNDPVAQCYVWCLKNTYDDEYLPLLKQSADSGFALAQAEYSEHLYTEYGSRYELSLEYAKKAAEQNERKGFACLYDLYIMTFQDDSITHEACKKAAEMGCVACFSDFGDQCRIAKQKLFWYSKFAQKGNYAKLFQFVHEKYLLFEDDTRYLAGKYCLKYVTKFSLVDDWIVVKQAMKFYTMQNKACRQAVDAWSIIASRMHICKDMRIYIAKFIWQTREEALFPCP